MRRAVASRAVNESCWTNSAATHGFERIAGRRRGRHETALAHGERDDATRTLFYKLDKMRGCHMFNKWYLLLLAIVAACAAQGGSDDVDILPGDINEIVQAICYGPASYGAASCPCDCPPCTTGGSPIILDLNGDGFALTDADGGVLFDLRANGIPELWAWTTTGSDDAFLVLDRDGDGAITSGAELFGNYTDQPANPNLIPNGYLALAVFDTNRDGQIDSSDPIYPALRLWVDKNHDGMSQAEELHTLAEFGILSLSTAYVTQARVDRNGNIFRFRSSLTRAPGSHVNRITYDVLLGEASAGSAVEQSTAVVPLVACTYDGCIAQSSMDTRQAWCSSCANVPSCYNAATQSQTYWNNWCYNRFNTAMCP
jgi:hypothetical protein